MSSHEKKEIVEDVPVYRSVMMAGPLSAPPMPRSFARSSEIPLKTAPRAPTVKQTAVHTSLSSSPIGLWRVSEIPSLPAAYFLERSNVYVDGKPQEIANRVCDSLRAASIAHSAHSDDKCLLLAETCESVKFAVRLFMDQGKIVVEVQRKCGCAFQFREAARTILRSAKGLGSVPKRKFCVPNSLPRMSAEQQQQRAEAGLEIAMKQLDSERVDSQLIGMEGLEQLTRCNQSAFVCNKILDESCLTKVLGAAKANCADSNTNMEEARTAVMKRRAMTVVANALATLAEAGNLDDVLRQSAELKSEDFVYNLVDTLRESAKAPHEATQAARCLQQLMACKEVEDILLEMSVSSVVSDACVAGACQSRLFEQESKRLKVMLSSN